MENFVLYMEKFLEFINNMINGIKDLISKFQNVGKTPSEDE